MAEHSTVVHDARDPYYCLVVSSTEPGIVRVSAQVGPTDPETTVVVDVKLTDLLAALPQA